MAEETNARQLLVFSLGEEEYALPVTSVQEIIHYTHPRAVASEAHWIQGVISLRGKIIPVADLAARLGLVTESAEAIDGIVKIDDRLIILLDLDSLFGGIDLAAAA